MRLDHVASHIVTGISGLKKRVWADLFVTLGFGSLSQIAMSSALRVFTRGMFGFAEITVIVTLVCLLAQLHSSILLPRAARTSGLRCDRIELATSEKRPGSASLSKRNHAVAPFPALRVRSR
jgi:hypothetical protein